MANNAKHPQISLLLTRPKGVAQAFFDALPQEIQALTRPIISPLIEIVALDAVVPKADLVIFTSATAVEFAGTPQGQHAYCVGEVTTRKARERGWNAVQMGETANELITNVIGLKPTAPLVHLAGRHTRGNIASSLTNANVTTQHVALYDQKWQDLTEAAAAALNGEAPVIIPLFSPRTAQRLMSQTLGAAPKHIITLSDAITRELHLDDRANVKTCSTPSRKAMIQEIKNTVLALTLG